MTERRESNTVVRRIPTETISDTQHFLTALGRFKEINPQFLDVPFSEFPSKAASDVISAAQTLKTLAADTNSPGY